VIAVGCLAAAPALGPVLVVGYVMAQIIGAAAHVKGTTVPAAEFVVALTVIGLGAVLIVQRMLPSLLILGLFLLAGLLHGYALAESIIGAEPAPLAAYFVGFALIQTLIALGAMTLVRVAPPPLAGQHVNLRLVGAGIAGFGIATALTQLFPAA
jgi:urease accessory protein